MEKKLIGLMPVRNEQWILGLTARVALMWCDELVIFDHASIDSSVEIEVNVAAEHPGRVTLMADLEPKWDEMRHRQDMLTMARSRGATHIAIIDADEMLTANLIGDMNRTVKSLPAGMLQLPLYNLRGSAYQYHANGIWGERSVTAAFRDQPDAGWGGDKFHSREPMRGRRSWPVKHGVGGVLHFWGANERRLRAKHALYKITERLRWPDKHVSEIDSMYTLWRAEPPLECDPLWPRTMWPANPEAWQFQLAPSAWYEGLEPLFDRHLFVAAEPPWQEEEVQRLFRLHPTAVVGLDMFGVV